MPRLGVPGEHLDVCMYDDDCQGTPSERFPVNVCDSHAIKVHERVEMILALERMRERHADRRAGRPDTELSSEFRSSCDDIMADYGEQLGPEGSVYYVRLENLVKIGFSRNPAQRLKDIPHQEVLLIKPGAMLDERIAHAQGAAWRVLGEWFRDCPEFRAAVGLDTPVAAK